MKVFKAILLLFISCFICRLLPAQVVNNTTYTIGASGDFPTLAAAISALNSTASPTGVVFSLIENADLSSCSTPNITKPVTIKGNTVNADGTPNIIISQGTGTCRHFTMSAAVTFQDLALIGPNAIYSGGAVTPAGTANIGGGINATGALTINNCIIAGCSVTGTGGGISTTAAITLTNSSVLYNTSTTNGGGISTTTTAATTTLTNSSVLYNTSTGNGGGINTTGATTLTSSSVLYNATSANGGGIFANNSLTLINDTISSNNAGFNGTTFFGSFSGGGVYANNNFILSGSLICKSNMASQNGGGIYKSATASTSIDAMALTYLAVESNSAGAGVASGAGGGIYSARPLYLTSLTLGSISYNTSANTGAGIHAADSLQLNNARVTNNSAASNGGGIYANSSLTLINDTIYSNNAGFNGTSFTGSFSGGGVYANNNFTLSGSLICKSNTASQNGGGIYKSATANTSIDATALTYLVVDSNSSGAGGSGAGGGIYSARPLNLTSLTQGSISYNTSASTGAGIHAADSLLLNNTRVTNNKATGYGGGLYLFKSAVLTSDTITDNLSSSSGGGIAFASGGPDTLKLRGDMVFKKDSSLNGNTANRGGGAVFFLTSTSKVVLATAEDGLTSMLIDSCYVSGTANDGAAFCVSNNPTTTYNSLIIKGAPNVPITFSNGVASRNGGAIMMCGQLELSGILFYNNSAGSTQGGGAIMRSNSSGTTPCIITNCTFQENKTAATNTGGAIHIANNMTVPPEITNCTFYKNSNTSNDASLSNGSAIYATSPTIVKFCTFAGNAATAAGNFSSISSPIGTMTFNGNIVQDNIGASTLSINVKGSYNIVSSAADITKLGGTSNAINTTASAIFADVNSGVPVIANNGGSTPTVLIKRNAIAHNFIPIDAANAFAVVTDQRDGVRPVGCKYDAGSVEIQEADDPATYAFKQNAAFCINSLVSLDTLITSTTFMKDTLYYSDAAYTQQITTLPVTMTNQAGFYFRFTTTSNCPMDAAMPVTVNALPTATFTADESICAGSDAQLVINLTGQQPYSILYTDPSNNSIAVNDIATNTYTINVSNVQADSIFTLVNVADANTCANTTFTKTTATLTAKPVPSVAIVPPANDTLQIGTSKQLTATPAGGTWSSSNDAVATVNTTGDVTGDGEGNVQIVYSYTDANGCAANDTISMVINLTGPLPVKLLFFKAAQNGSNALLTWATATEQNSRYFDIEQSSDGAHFTKIGQVASAGNSNTRIDYSFTDNNILRYNTGKIYYRFRQEDIDGKFTYSEIVQLNVTEPTGGALTAYPNPFDNKFTIVLPQSINGYTEITLTDASGRTVYKQTFNISASQKSIEISDLKALPTGTYVASVRTSKGIWQTKVIRNR